MKVPGAVNATNARGRTPKGVIAICALCYRGGAFHTKK